MPGAAQVALAINTNHLALKAIYRVSTLRVTELVTNKIVGDILSCLRGSSTQSYFLATTNLCNPAEI